MASKRYYPVAIPGSGADHLAYEVEENLSRDGYDSHAAAKDGWFNACKQADAHRRSLGYSPVSRPRCRVEAKEETWAEYQRRVNPIS